MTYIYIHVYIYACIRTYTWICIYGCTHAVPLLVGWQRRKRIARRHDVRKQLEKRVNIVSDDRLVPIFVSGTHSIQNKIMFLRAHTHTHIPTYPQTHIHKHTYLRTHTHTPTPDQALLPPPPPPPLPTAQASHGLHSFLRRHPRIECGTCHLWKDIYICMYVYIYIYIYTHIYIYQ